VINNGTSNASNVILTDAQPAYTTYQAGSARSAKGPAVNYNAATALTDASDGDGYDLTSQQRTRPPTTSVPLPRVRQIKFSCFSQ